MKKIKIMLLFFSVLLLIACTDSSKNDELKANISDFEDSGFTNKSNQLIFLTEEGIMIDSHVLRGKGHKKSNIDRVLEKENIPLTQQFNKVYKDATIKTDGSKYYITLNENIKLEFEKIGARIIEDLEGVEYYTQEYSKKN